MTAPPHRIVLVGPMGVGKSTIGRILGRLLGFGFRDTDQIIESRSGADIAWIFDVEGEAGFRRREHRVLRQALAESEVVIASGGGAVTQLENRELLEAESCVVYLTADLEQLVERTARDRKRPLLQVNDPRQRIEALFRERDPLYRAVANRVVKTDQRPPRRVADEILGKLGLR